MVPQLRRRKVDFRPGMAVTAIEPGPVVIAGAARQEFDLVMLATGAAPLPWLRSSGLATDERGFVLVHATLQSVSHPEVFALGDCATLRDSPHPKSGVYAVRHGESLIANLRRLFGGQPSSPTCRRRARSMLLTCGARYAIAQRGNWSAQGRWLWWLEGPHRPALGRELQVRSLHPLEEDFMKKFVVGLAAALVPLAALAAYPERPVKMVVPWAAGGDTDNIFRPFAQVLQKHSARPWSSPTSAAPRARKRREGSEGLAAPTATRYTRCTTTSTRPTGPAWPT